jgi:hypothetical protein
MHVSLPDFRLAQIGPVRPVQSQDAPPVDMSKWYEGKNVLIYSESPRTLIAKVPLDPDGNYRTLLEPGSYVIDMELERIQRGTGIPKTVEIKTGKSLRVNIDIDTGIR